MKRLVLFAIILAIYSPNIYSQCGRVSLTGEFNNWEGDFLLDREPENPDLFSAILTLTQSDDISDPPDGIIEMKFRENGDWGVNWSDDDFPSGIGVQDGSGIPVPVGTYHITFNCNTGAYNFQSTCGTISLIGEFNGWADDLIMVRAEDDPDSWSVILSIEEDDDTDMNGIIEMKLRENQHWEINWGDDDFPSGIAILNGPNIQVPLDEDEPTTDYLVTFNCSTRAYNFEKTSGPISLIGEFTEWADDLFMSRDEENPNLFSVILSMTDQDDMDDPPDGIIQLKFRESKDWSNNWGDDDFPSGTAMQNGPNIPVPLDDAGITTDYLVTFNAETLEYDFESTSGPISIIGSFSNWIQDVPMNRDADNPNLWKLTRSWFENSEIKFRENQDWAENWGNTNWPGGTGEGNGPNIPLIAGIYDVTFNYSNLEYNFVENQDVCGEIGLVGNFNNWQVPTETIMVRDPIYPSQFSLDYNFTESTSLFFKLVDGEVIGNDNIWGGDFPCDNGTHDVTLWIEVPAGFYHITFNCQSGDFCFESLNNQVIAPRAFTMNIDGVLNESEWNIQTPVAKLVDGELTDDPNEVLFGATYNYEYLYIGIDVKDGIIGPEDGGEIFIDGDNSQGEYDDADIHLKYSAAGIEVIQGPENIFTMLGFMVNSSGYSVEIAIPLEDLGIDPVENEDIGFDIFIWDDDQSGSVDYILAWNGDLENYSNTSQLGKLIFGNFSCGCVSLYNEAFGDVILRNPTDMPNNYVATFQLYGDYDVVFRKDTQNLVTWGDNNFPGGTAVIDGPHIPATAGRYRINFDCISGEYLFEELSLLDGVAYAVHTDIPEEIDGELDNYTLFYKSDNLVSSGGPVNNIVEWGALWDENNLYIGAHIIDEPLLFGVNPWDSDAIEIFIDGNNDKDGPYDPDFDTHIIRDVNPETDLWIRADGVPLTNYEAEWIAYGDGYYVEIRLSWEDFSFTPDFGRNIGFSLSNNDNDNGVGRDYQTTWYGTGNNWHTTEDLGEMQMAEEVYTNVEIKKKENPEIVILPNPSNGQFYIKFTGSDIQGSFEIQIKDVSGHLIVKQMIDGPATNGLIPVSAQNLNPGIYFLDILWQDGKRVVEKLVIH